MDGKRLLALLDAPAQAEGADRDDLAGWCSRFPWASAFAVLLARASHAADHGDSERDLLRACAHAPNRQRVYSVVEGGVSLGLSLSLSSSLSLSESLSSS